MTIRGHWLNHQVLKVFVFLVFLLIRKRDSEVPEEISRTNTPSVIAASTHERPTSDSSRPESSRIEDAEDISAQHEDDLSEMWV